MSDITRILERAHQGDPQAAEELLPLIYEELRRLAAARMAGEVAGQTLQATALVHEAWLRLTGNAHQQWDGRAHFFAAARRRCGGFWSSARGAGGASGMAAAMSGWNWTPLEIPAVAEDEKLIQVNEVLGELETEDATEAQVVKMKFFMGMKADEIAAALGVSEKTVQRQWAHARAWLYQRIRSQS